MVRRGEAVRVRRGAIRGGHGENGKRRRRRRLRWRQSWSEDADKPRRGTSAKAPRGQGHRTSEDLLQQGGGGALDDRGTAASQTSTPSPQRGHS